MKPQNFEMEKNCQHLTKFNGNVKIAIIGKYVDLKDSYVSVYQALLHAGAKIRQGNRNRLDRF